MHHPPASCWNLEVTEVIDTAATPAADSSSAPANTVYLSHKAEMDRVRRTLRDAVGAETFRNLHRELPWLDALTVIGALGIFATVAMLLARLAFGPLWLGLFVLQGFVLQW